MSPRLPQTLCFLWLLKPCSWVSRLWSVSAAYRPARRRGLMRAGAFRRGCGWPGGDVAFCGALRDTQYLFLFLGRRFWEGAGWSSSLGSAGCPSAPTLPVLVLWARSYVRCPPGPVQCGAQRPRLLTGVCVCTLTWLSVQAGRPPRLAPSQGHPGRCGASSSTPHPGSLGPAGGRGAREHTDASSSLRHGFTLSSVTALPFSTVRWSSSPCSTET